MNTSKTCRLPARLEALRRRFEQWRRTHSRRSPLPDALWTAAVKMTAIYGLHRTARALPVAYYSLKRQIKMRSAAAEQGHASGPATAFLELPASLPAGTCDCTLEWENAAGAKMRVHLKAAPSPDLAALCRSIRDPLA